MQPIGANRELRAYALSLAIWGVFAAILTIGAPADVALSCTPFVVTLIGAFCFGPRAMALGFGIHTPPRSRQLGWQPPPLSDHIATHRTPIGQLRHSYRQLELRHPVADVPRCDLCQREGIRLFTDGIPRVRTTKPPAAKQQGAL